MNIAAPLILPIELKKTLVELSAPIHNDSLDYFKTEIENFKEEIKTRMDYNEFTDVRLTEQLISLAEFLLEVYPERKAREQRMIIAALRYFIHDEELDADVDHPYPFDIDAQIMNAVVLYLGYQDRFIPT